MRTDLKPVPDRINGYPVLAHRPATLSQHEICEVVLVRAADKGGYIVWAWNRQNPGAHHGTYGLSTIEKAATAFVGCYVDVRQWTPEMRALYVTFTNAATNTEVAALALTLAGST